MLKTQFNGDIIGKVSPLEYLLVFVFPKVQIFVYVPQYWAAANNVCSTLVTTNERGYKKPYTTYINSEKIRF